MPVCDVLVPVNALRLLIERYYRPMADAVKLRCYRCLYLCVIIPVKPLQRFVLKANYSDLRAEALRLRTEEGLSYAEIAARMGLRKSTLSYWLRDAQLSEEHRARLQQRLDENRAGFAARAWPVNQLRHATAREIAAAAGRESALSAPNDARVHELAFAMLYLGEGAKTGNRLSIASMRADILRYTVWFIPTIYGVPAERIRCRLHLVQLAEMRDTELRGWWSEALGLPLAQFRRSAYDRRERQTELTDDYRGVCEVVCLDTALQQRVMAAAQTYIEACAGTGNENSRS